MIIPKPSSCELMPGSFNFSDSCTIEIASHDPGLVGAAHYLQTLLRAAPCSLVIEVVMADNQSEPATGRGTIRLGLTGASEPIANVDLVCGEQYELTLSNNLVEVVAAQSAGLTRGVQSLHQLVLRHVALDDAHGGQSSNEVVVPAMRIADSPRFGWRGMLLDSSRHFFSVADIKRFIDLLAAFKFNMFHWHLTDDQGWRIEIDAFPELTSVGAKRSGDEPSRNGFYTKEQVREVIAYASQSHIEVVPEIDLPGHTRAVLAALPHLSCTGRPFAVSTKWGVHKDVLCLGNPHVGEFIELVLAEVAELFPGRYIHLGGDECPVERWGECAKCKHLVEAEGLRGEGDLQTWFSGRVARYLEQLGRTAIFWDEVLDGGLPAGVALMSWRGVEHGQRAAELGHDAIMTPESHVYFDYRQSPDGLDPGASWADPTTLQKVYGFDPTAGLTDTDDIGHVLGGQGNVWTEFIPDMTKVEAMVLPRMCALAEVLWTDTASQDWSEFRSRLTGHAPWIRSIYNHHDTL